MKPLPNLLLLPLAPVYACSSDTGSDRFTDVVTASGMRTLIDEATSLQWVNDEDACNRLGALADDTPMRARMLCESVVFAGFDDWCMPSETEAANLIRDAVADDFDLTHRNPSCPAVVAMEGSYVQTQNGMSPGSATAMPPSTGIRCARNL